MTISLYVEWVLLLLLFCLTAITNDSLASLFAVAIFEVVCSFVCCFPTGMRNFHEQQQQNTNKILLQLKVFLLVHLVDTHDSRFIFIPLIHESLFFLLNHMVFGIFVRHFNWAVYNINACTTKTVENFVKIVQLEKCAHCTHQKLLQIKVYSQNSRGKKPRNVRCKQD